MTARNIAVTTTRAMRLAQLAGVTRVAFGAAFVVAPKIMARPWAGSGVDTAGAQLLTRSMGVRDLLLGVGLLHALNRNDKHAASRWLGYGATAGIVDAAATLLAFRDLPRSGRSFLGFIVAALVIDTYLAITLRRPDLPER